mmetsp:Transcript_17926/g.26530  ORF Transcript_17926/g.26530 Transcript_17926/m.26530 type:complete len:380 (+) Transcript_17926:16-1155(+)|eukprot:CAMPEP_0194201172 /NCGR_PEP_ID=MMETSP0156-20130528/1512_1 /TAXON_ID=33649 /ORGANISM="Thalassionema nitzschioides, Strain L26-B" /LENGTH=379 /DNA_ID=CAMNT_0038926301 /DNA_START=15 /DNA_END=1154 /DNA_ORIENTATION=-
MSHCQGDQDGDDGALINSWKRSCANTGIEAAERVAKKARETYGIEETSSQILMPNTGSTGKRELFPAPFFRYRDFSREIDPDPLTPLTPPGRVPNFPAKMHAILSRPDLSDIVAWMPHGRAWRVLKPREFEVQVIPIYFEHSKFSSFVRQANGWGFRRITQGNDRNGYYHELFLRGLPHLCKKMKRPGVAEKEAAAAEHEPALQKISVIYPVPEKADDDSIMLQFTVSGGPKARMPIYSGGGFSSTVSHADNESSADAKSLAAQIVAENDTSAAQQNSQASQVEQVPKQNVYPMLVYQPAFVHPSAPAQLIPTTALNFGPCLTPVNYQYAPSLQTPIPMPLPTSASASQFAAGFAAAQALNNNHLRNVFGQVFPQSNAQ